MTSIYNYPGTNQRRHSSSRNPAASLQSCSDAMGTHAYHAEKQVASGDAEAADKAWGTGTELLCRLAIIHWADTDLLIWRMERFFAANRTRPQIKMLALNGLMQAAHAFYRKSAAKPQTNWTFDQHDSDGACLDYVRGIQSQTSALRAKKGDSQEQHLEGFRESSDIMMTALHIITDGAIAANMDVDIYLQRYYLLLDRCVTLGMLRECSMSRIIERGHIFYNGIADKPEMKWLNKPIQKPDAQDTEQQPAD